jgi:hypothetical protein
VRLDGHAELAGLRFARDNGVGVRERIGRRGTSNEQEQNDGHERAHVVSVIR